jgi:hypothetical protein
VRIDRSFHPPPRRNVMRHCTRSRLSIHASTSSLRQAIEPGPVLIGLGKSPNLDFAHKEVRPMATTWQTFRAFQSSTLL